MFGVCVYSAMHCMHNEQFQIKTFQNDAKHIGVDRRGAGGMPTNMLLTVCVCVSVCTYALDRQRLRNDIIPFERLSVSCVNQEAAEAAPLSATAPAIRIPDNPLDNRRML